mmetsp:Transcript_5380/g.8809  ORF Transcript_5380/g.8809 Transcript_5380/m.8809 type:complete len:407 (+) Transcript_5380:69-1289(+)
MVSLGALVETVMEKLHERFEISEVLEGHLIAAIKLSDGINLNVESAKKIFQSLRAKYKVNRLPGKKVDGWVGINIIMRACYVLIVLARNETPELFWQSTVTLAEHASYRKDFRGLNQETLETLLFYRNVMVAALQITPCGWHKGEVLDICSTLIGEEPLVYGGGQSVQANYRAIIYHTESGTPFPETVEKVRRRTAAGVPQKVGGTKRKCVLVAATYEKNSESSCCPKDSVKKRKVDFIAPVPKPQSEHASVPSLPNVSPTQPAAAAAAPSPSPILNDDDSAGFGFGLGSCWSWVGDLDMPLAAAITTNAAAESQAGLPLNAPTSTTTTTTTASTTSTTSTTTCSSSTGTSACSARAAAVPISVSAVVEGPAVPVLNAENLQSLGSRPIALLPLVKQEQHHHHQQQ